LIKDLLSASHGLNIENSLALAADMNAKARDTADCRKGIHTFLNKKTISW
jgi:methylglutaconyl-CoA hydratase